MTLGSLSSHDAEDVMAERPPLFVCHGDDSGIWIHPWRRVQVALRASRVDYENRITGHGSVTPTRHGGLKANLPVSRCARPDAGTWSS
jgi:hypothetical protein